MSSGRSATVQRLPVRRFNSASSLPSEKPKQAQVEGSDRLSHRPPSRVVSGPWRPARSGSCVLKIQCLSIGIGRSYQRSFEHISVGCRSPGWSSGGSHPSPDRQPRPRRPAPDGILFRQLGGFGTALRQHGTRKRSGPPAQLFISGGKGQSKLSR
jgi:hypothetical protein